MSRTEYMDVVVSSAIGCSLVPLIECCWEQSLPALFAHALDLEHGGVLPMRYNSLSVLRDRRTPLCHFMCLVFVVEDAVEADSAGKWTMFGGIFATTIVGLTSLWGWLPKPRRFFLGTICSTSLAEFDDHVSTNNLQDQTGSSIVATVRFITFSVEYIRDKRLLMIFALMKLLNAHVSLGASLYLVFKIDYTEWVMLKTS